MSVINESQAGDELVCISEFSGPPEGVMRSSENCRTFRMGERVRYVRYFQHENLKDNPVCWMVVFDAEDGKRYAATQTLFVTVEIWERLKKFFAKRMLREPKSKPARKKNAVAMASTP